MLRRQLLPHLFQLLRLRLAEGVELDLYNSHLEAGGGEADQEARAVHVEQLVESMTTESEGRAVLFLADTNLHRSDPTDLPLLERLEEEAGLSDACEEVGCSEPDHIDRLMFREAAGLSLEPLEWTNELDFFDSDGVPLSDHPALSAVFAWSSP